MNTYTCPHCHTALNVSGFLVLTAKNPSGAYGLILMSDQLGDYSVHINKDFQVEKGERTCFYCPACKGSLSYSKDNNLVRIFMTDSDTGEESTIIFSAIFGENATYQISEKREKSYGEMISKFKDPGWYLNDD